MRLFAGLSCALIGWLGTVSCIQKDTQVDTGPEEEEEQGQSLCADYCDKVDENCGAMRSCESTCTDLATNCDSQATAFIECALIKPMNCSATGTPDTAGCDSEFDSLNSCLNSAGGASCSAMFDSCAETFCCEDGSTCVESFDEDFGGLVCVPNCEGSAGCFTGCCLELTGGGAACGFWGDCTPADTGGSCWRDSDCAVGFCLDGGCSKECSSDEDCGSSFLGLKNICVELADGAYCLPGCETTDDCDFYYETPNVDLTCLQGETGNYCY